MIIQRIICDRCGFEQQEDDYDPADWDQRFKREDACKLCVKSATALTEGTEPRLARNPHLPEKPADGKHMFGEDGRSYRCTRCGVYNRTDSPPFHEPCQGAWAESGKMRAWAEDKWASELLAAATTEGEA